MKKLICWIFGHKWSREWWNGPFANPQYTRVFYDRCPRCGKKLK